MSLFVGIWVDWRKKPTAIRYFYNCCVDIYFVSSVSLWWATWKVKWQCIRISQLSASWYLILSINIDCNCKKVWLHWTIFRFQAPPRPWSYDQNDICRTRRARKRLNVYATIRGWKRVMLSSSCCKPRRCQNEKILKASFRSSSPWFTKNARIQRENRHQRSSMPVRNNSWCLHLIVRNIRLPVHLMQAVSFARFCSVFH